MGSIFKKDASPTRSARDLSEFVQSFETLRGQLWRDGEILPRKAPLRYDAAEGLIVFNDPVFREVLLGVGDAAMTWSSKAAADVFDLVEAKVRRSYPSLYLDLFSLFLTNVWDIFLPAMKGPERTSLVIDSIFVPVMGRVLEPQEFFKVLLDTPPNVGPNGRVWVATKKALSDVGRSTGDVLHTSVKLAAFYVAHGNAVAKSLEIWKYARAAQRSHS